jgi:hypothetical protein
MIGNTMTMARPERKTSLGACGKALLAALLAGLPAGEPLLAATTQRLVVDPHSGLAIAGFDPVAYFTDGEALPGNGAFEHPFGGAVWRFRSEGNAAAFAADPDVYVPATAATIRSGSRAAPRFRAIRSFGSSGRNASISSIPMRPEIGFRATPIALLQPQIAHGRLFSGRLRNDPDSYAAWHAPCTRCTPQPAGLDSRCETLVFVTNRGLRGSFVRPPIQRGN